MNIASNLAQHRECNYIGVAQVTVLWVLTLILHFGETCFHHLQAELIRFKQALKGTGRGNSLITQGGSKKSPVRTTDTTERILCQANILATSLRSALGLNSLQRWWQHPTPKILPSTYDPTGCQNLAVILTWNLPETLFIRKNRHYQNPYLF